MANVMDAEVTHPLDSTGAVGPLRGHAISGGHWALAASLTNKILTVATQVLLAWCLVPQDFGLAAMAASAASIAAILSGTNLKTVLIQEASRFEENRGHVFWLSLVLNFASGALVALLAPFAAAAFGQGQVITLMLLISAASPFMALPTIYAAALNRELRFRAIGLLQCGEGLIRNGLAILLAVLGFGAYSLVLPLLLGAILSAVLHRWTVGKLSVGTPCPKQWPPLLRQAAWLMLTSFLTAMLAYGANLVIGLLHDPTVTGLFFWGFSLSSQAVFLLATNLRGVFFPILTKLRGDPARQQKAFHHSVHVLTIVVALACVLQALLAQPVVEMVFASRWWPAVPVIQWLSLGMMTQPVHVLSVSLLMARGAYPVLAKSAAASLALTLGGTLIGASLGGVATIAQWVGTCSFLANCVPAFFVLRGGTAALLHSAAFPILLALSVLAGGYLVLGFLDPLSPLLQAVVVGLAAVFFYAVATAACFPQALASFKQILGFRGCDS